jgi:hypothetical protein
MAFVLALGGRGFTEIGTQGLRATEVVGAASAEQVILLDQRLSDLELQLAQLQGKV